jgi:succinate-semialdehyde dehydrogenase/glutarate-semialdehyde dehydrogenase
MYTRFGLFIDGTWRRAADGQTAPVMSPVSETALGDVPVAGIADTEAALAAAEEGLARWRATPAFTRADALHAIADEMVRRAPEAARMISSETGKPIAQAAREWVLSTDQFRWYAEEARRIYGRIVESRVPGGRFEVSHEPLGIAAAFTAWNFPAALVARKVAPALAAGCSVIVRPSSQTPGVAMVMVDCCQAGNLPPGVVNLVVGPTASTYKPIMASKAVRKVSLTGSTRVGQQMVRDAADTMKKVSMELGGNAPLIVFGDAEENVIDEVVIAKLRNGGQSCIAANRLLVEASIADSFTDALTRRFASIGVGPLIDAAAVTKVRSMVTEAEDFGAKVAYRGEVPSGRGYFFPPTVLTGVPPTCSVYREEIFGPVATVTTFSSEDEAVALANSTEAGLAGYVFSADLGRALRVGARLDFGIVGINRGFVSTAAAPFGGVKTSGLGREGGLRGLDEYLETQYLSLPV